jgi:hypothetical protein
VSVPTNLIPTKITGLPEYTGSSQAGYFPYVLDGSTYKVQFSNVASAGEVPPSRTLTAGTGLVGGGDLSANRVFAIANGGVGASQLDTTGVVAGVYGNGSNVPTVTVDANGRVTSVTTSPVVATGYVPEGRLIIAGTGLTGGGSLAGNITLSLNLATATPQALGIATAGVSIAAARGDHVHPAVDLSDTNETQGSLPLGRGGTGDALSPVAGAVVYSTGSKFALTNPGIAGQVLTSGGTDEPSWTTITGIGSVTSVNASGGATGMTFTGGPITTAGTLTLGGTLSATSGGTGLSAAPANGQLAIGNGTGYSLSTITAGTGVSVTNAAGSITIDNTAPDQIVSLTAGTAISVSGTYPNFTIGNTAPDQIVSLTGAGTTSISGTYPNFTITSNDQFSGTVTSVAASGGATGLTFTGSPITTSGTLTLGGTLAVASGGTGQTTYTNGQLLIGNTTGNTLTRATLTAGANISITNGAGSITIASTDQFVGTVTSVAASGGATGLTFSGSPITSAGTLTLGGTLAVASGGTGASNAGAARTALGAAALGANTDITSIALTSGTIQNAPTSGTDIVNKAYADSIASGINFHQAVRLATVAALPAYTYNNGTGGVGATITANANGALSIDGVAVVAGNRVLIKNEVGAAQANHGVYVVTQTGNGSTPYILTRATDFDSTGTGVDQIDAGDFFLVTAGATLTNTSWVQQTPLPITVGTTPIIFSQFGAPVLYTAGTGLSLAGTVFSITNTGVSASTYGSASQVPVIAVNAQGQITSASSTSISIAASQITSGVLPVGNGGTGANTLAANGVLLGNGTSAVSATAVGTTGQVLVGNTGAAPTWATLSSAAVTSFSAGTTGLTPSSPTTGAVTLGGTLAVANGGTGVTTSTGTGSVVLNTSPTLVTPTLGAASATSIANGLGAVGTPSYTFTGDLNTGMWSPAADTIAFSEGGVEAMRIDSSANVGIGTTVPRSILSAASATGSTLTLESTDTTLTSNDVVGEIDFYANDGSVNGIGVKASVRAFANDAAGNNIALAFATSDGTSLATDRMVITGPGNVGIGTTAPQRILHIATAEPTVVLQTTSAAVDENRWRVRVSTAGDFAIGTMNDAFSAGQNAYVIDRSTDITVENHIWSTAGSERMRLTSVGSLLVATTSASSTGTADGFAVSGATGALLSRRTSGANQNHINFVNNGVSVGTINTSTTATTYNTSSTSGLTGVDANTVAFRTNSAERMRIDASGNVIIGTTSSPTVSRLYIDSTEARIQSRNSTSGANGYIGAMNPNEWRGAWAITSTPVTFGTSDTERMRITSAGNVGIGTSSPGFLLHGVQNGNAEFRVSATNVGTNSAGLTVENEGNRNWNLWANRSTDNFVIGANSRANDFLVINGSSGNVGIGTSSPAQRLDVNGNINASGTGQFTAATYCFVGTTSGTVQGQFAANAGGSVDVRAVSNHPMLFYTNNTERMRVTAAGLVGIGLTNPASLLHVKQSSDAIEVYPSGTWAGRVINAADAAGFNGLLVGNRWAGTGSTVFEAGSIFGGGTGSWYSYYRIDGTGQSIWSNSGTERMRLTTAGNVGIGTSAPGVRLDVIGNATFGRGGGTFQGITLTNGDNSASAETVSFIDARNNLGTADGHIFFGHQTDGGSYITFGTTPPGDRAVDRRAERMRITPAGNVGIGTTNPSERLDTGTGNTRTQALVLSGDQHLLYSASATELGIRIGTGGPFFGIGTTGSSNMRINNASGGDMLFAIAGTERMRVNSSGLVGIGTTTPSARLDVRSPAGTDNVVANRAGNAAYFVLQGTSFPNFSQVQSFDGSGNLYWAIGGNGSANTLAFMVNGANQRMLIASDGSTTLNVGGVSSTHQFLYNENGAEIQLSDATGNGPILIDNSGGLARFYKVGTGSMSIGTTSTGILQFITNNAERARINSSGDFLIGTSSGGRTVCINSTDNWIRQQNASRSWLIGPSVGSNYLIFDETGGATRLTIDTSGNVTAAGNVTAYSDARLKKDVETIDGALDLVSKMRGVRYTRIDTEKRGVGVIAQEMLEVMPELVQQGTEDDDTLSVAYGNIVGVLIEAVKELTARVAELEGK